jgi:hypothetical protein
MQGKLFIRIRINRFTEFFDLEILKESLIGLKKDPFMTNNFGKILSKAKKK